MSVRRLAPAEIQPASFAFAPETASFADRTVAKYPEGRQASAVISLLWKTQKQSGGWLPQKAIEAVAARLGMPLIRVMEVATFYTMFNLEPVGRYFIQLCGTVPCHVKGAIDLKQVLLDRVGDQHHVTADGTFSWLEVECLGACCNAPMVQINDDYFEDLTPDLLIRLLDDLQAGRPVMPGPQSDRRSSEPEGDVKTLTDPALFDGSLVGTWRKRFDEAQATPSATGETAAATATGPGDPKAAKPDAGRATERPVAAAPAQNSQNGEAPVSGQAAAKAGRTDTATETEPGSWTGTRPPESSKSYIGTPSKPDAGRVVAGSPSSPVSGAPGVGEPERRDGSAAKPVGADPDASPGVAPKE